MSELDMVPNLTRKYWIRLKKQKQSFLFVLAVIDKEKVLKLTPGTCIIKLLLAKLMV
jgi:hypothetical protein